jgi:hypothetical protein
MLLTQQVTSRWKVFLEKLIATMLVKKYPVMDNTIFTTAYQGTLS